MSQYRKRPTLTEAITFDELVAYGRASGAPVVNGMPWSFEYNGHPITHETDGCYLIPTSNGTVKLKRGDMLCVQNVAGRSDIWPVAADIFAATYEPADSGAPAEMPEAPNSVWLVVGRERGQVMACHGDEFSAIADVKARGGNYIICKGERANRNGGSTRESHQEGVMDFDDPTLGAASPTDAARGEGRVVEQHSSPDVTETVATGTSPAPQVEALIAELRETEDIFRGLRMGIRAGLAADTIERQQREIDALREALQDYSFHKSACEYVTGPCTCGLRAALRAGEAT